MRYLVKRGDGEAFIPRSVVILGGPDQRRGGVFSGFATAGGLGFFFWVLSWLH